MVREHPAGADQREVPSVEAEGAPDDDSWNDADPFAIQEYEPPSLSPQTTPAVARLVRDLEADRERSGRLTLVDVTNLAQRRGMSSELVEESLLLLAAAGVEVGDEPTLATYDGADDLDGGVIRRLASTLERDQLSAYFASAGKIKLLGSDQEVRLGRAIQAGRAGLASLTVDEATLTPLGTSSGSSNSTSLDGAPAVQRLIEAGRQAHRDLVSANLRLVISIAKLPRYRASGVEFADRIQDGNIGLLRAADKFDPELGYKFSTYATWWIRQAIDRGIGDRGRSIRLPIYQHDRLRKISAARSRIEGMQGRSATLQEIAAAVGLDASQVAAALAMSKTPLSYDTFVGDEGDVTLIELLERDAEGVIGGDPAEIAILGEFADDVRFFVETNFSTRDAQILLARYGFDGESPTYDELGVRHGVTRERVRQIVAKALEVARGRPRIHELYEYLLSDCREDEAPSPLRQAGHKVDKHASTAPRKRRI